MFQVQLIVKIVVKAVTARQPELQSVMNVLLMNCEMVRGNAFLALLKIPLTRLTERWDLYSVTSVTSENITSENILAGKVPVDSVQLDTTAKLGLWKLPRAIRVHEEHTRQPLLLPVVERFIYKARVYARLVHQDHTIAY